MGGAASSDLRHSSILAPSSTSCLSIPPCSSPGPKTAVPSLSLIIIQKSRGSKQTQPRLQAREPSKDDHLNLPVCPRRPFSLLQPLPPDLLAFCTPEVGPHRSHGVSTFASCCSTSGIRLLTLDPVICSLSWFSFFHDTERILQHRTPGKSPPSHSQLMPAS